MIQESKETSYYEILDISMNANHEMIRTAYIRAKNAYTRDSLAAYTLFDEEESQKILNQIEEAYTVLADKEKRKIYDESHGFLLYESNDSNMDKYGSPQENKTSQNAVYSSSTNQPLHAVKVSSAYTINEAMEEKLKNPTTVTGSFLREAREYKNISHDVLMDITKIKRHYLCAIEEDDISKLPAPVFVRGFVVQYAKALRLDGEKIASLYMSYLKSRSTT